MTCAGQKAKDAEIVNQSPLLCNKSQKVNDAELILSIVITPTSRDRKIEDTKFRAEDAIKKTRTNRIIKLSAKAKDAKKVLSNPQKTFSLKQSLEIENFIIQLTNLLGAWDEVNENIEVMTTQTREEMEPGYKDPLKILATRIILANAANQN